jgi:hypothetical protein
MAMTESNNLHRLRGRVKVLSAVIGGSAQAKRFSDTPAPAVTARQCRTDS